MSWTLRGIADGIWSDKRALKLADTVFEGHADPARAAMATISLRNAYPWLSPSLAAKMGAYGVNPDDPTVAELAGMSAARQARRGWVDSGGRLNSNEVRNATRPRRPSRYGRTGGTPGWSGIPGDDGSGGVTPDMLGIPTGTTQDYISNINLGGLGQEQMTPQLARRLRRGGNLGGRFEGLQAEFEGNRQTWEAARQIDEYGSTDFSTQEQAASNWRSDPGYAPLPGEEDNLAGTRPDELGAGPQANMAYARDLAGYLPSMDATVRHLRRGGMSFQGIPLPGGDVSAQQLSAVYLGPSQDEIGRVLGEERRRLEEQYPGLAGSSRTELPDGITPSMRAVYDGIVSALEDVIAPDVETGGLDWEGRIPGIDIDFDLNVADLWEVPQDISRGGIRTASMALDMLWQAGQAAYRNNVDASEDPTTAGALAPGFVAQFTDPTPHFPGSETDIGIALERLAAGESVDVGSGFFVNPESPLAQQRLERERQHGLVGAHVITMGRHFAQTVGFEPDTTPFDVLSGAVDLGWILAEPGGAAVDALTHSPAIRRALAFAGGFEATRSVQPGMFDEWIRGAHGQRVVEHYAAFDPTSPTFAQDVAADYAGMSRSGGATRMPEWAHYALADGDVGDVAYVEEYLRNFTGMGYQTPGVAARSRVTPGVSYRRRLTTSRLANDVPESGWRAVDRSDVDGAVNALRDSWRNARVPEEIINERVRTLYTEGVQVPTRVAVQRAERQLDDLPATGSVLWRGVDTSVDEVRAELMQVIDELRPGLFINRPVFRSGVLIDVWGEGQVDKFERLLAAGVPEAKAEEWTTLRDVGRRTATNMIEDHQSSGAYFTTLATDNARDGATNRRVWGVVDGALVADGTSPGLAHAYAEHLTRYLPLEEDPRQLARLTRNLPTRVLASWGRSGADGQLFAAWRGLDNYMSRVWKPSRLIRPAYPIRVVGEEQGRMGAAGLDSIFTHPMSAFALVMGTRVDGRLHRALDATTGGRVDSLGRMVTDSLGNRWDDVNEADAVAEFRQMLNRTIGSDRLFNSGSFSNGRFEPFVYRSFGGHPDQWEPGLAEAWADLFGRLHSGEDFRFVAQVLTGQHSQYDTLDELVEAGGGTVRTADELRMGSEPNVVKSMRADLAESHEQLLQRGPATWAARVATDPNAEILNWDDFIESVQVRLYEITGRDPDLLHLMARGRFPDGVPINRPGKAKINRAAANRLRDDYAQFVPETVPGDRMWHDEEMGRRNSRGGRVKSGLGDFYDRALEEAFSLFGAIPTDRLSRSPAFRQFHLRRMQELLPSMTADAQQAFLRNAEELMRVPGHEFHIRLSAYIDEADSTVPTMASLRAAVGQGTGDLSLEFADELAKYAALDNTRWLLYDVHKRGQFMDSMRIAFPFGEAWKEVITRWTQLFAQRPGTMIQRTTQLAALTGSPQEWEGVVNDPSQHGFLFTNATGETVFTYPGTRWFTASLTGIPIELTGALNGLTIVNSVMPGVGPAVQVPMAMIPALRDHPNLDGIRDVLFPFGFPDDPRAMPSGVGAFISDQLFSPAVQRIFQGIGAGGLDEVGVPGTDVDLGHTPGFDVVKAFSAVLGGGSAEWDRLFMNSAFDVMRYRVSAGRGSTGTEREVNRLVNDSMQDAALFFVIRGLAGMTLPSAPIPEFYMEDQTGSLLMLRALTDQYRAMQEEDYSTASQRFLELYGADMALVLQSKSVPNTATLAVTEEADRWVRENPSVTDEYALTYGLWAPGNTGDGFDFDAYNRGIRDRAMQVLGRELQLEDLVGLMNDRIASDLRRRREAEMLQDPAWRTEEGNLTSEGEQWLSTVYDPWLYDNYHGYRQDGLPDSVTSDDLWRSIGMPGQENTEVRRMLDDDRVAEPIREAVGLYVAKHDEILTMLAANPDRWGGSLTYRDSASTRSLRDHLRYEYIPWIREGLPEEYRDQWDNIVDRLFDRVMNPVWLEEGYEAEEIAA